MTDKTGFLREFSKGSLIAQLVKCLLSSAVNVGIIQLIWYLDHNFIWGEGALLFLLVPVGLINAALLVDAAYKFFRKPDWRSVITGVVEVINGIYFFVVLNELYSQAGPL